MPSRTKRCCEIRGAGTTSGVTDKNKKRNSYLQSKNEYDKL
ncbi:hypothetical protein BN179_3320003 [Clostridioides difficile T6]|nr:hypothetical protein BN179_3320003 [Clostridioides difficile T6]